MRFFLATLAIAAVSLAASADTVPPELAVIGEPSIVLNATYTAGSSEVSFKPGDMLNATVSKNAPQPHLHDLGLNSTDRYLLLMIDADYNKTNPLSVIVHMVVANLTTKINSTSEENVIATYIGPQPVSGTHNYTFFLFNQPSNFSVPARYESFMATNDQTPWNRLNLPLESFLSQTGLGAPVAANYFRVTAAKGNTTGTGTSSSSSPSPTTSTPASSTSSGAAMKMSVSHYLGGALAVVGAALVAA